jgi:hypothetical protein
MLTRYWFTFDLTLKQLPPPGTLLGCGVTAPSREAALQLLKDRVFRSDPLPPIKQCLEKVDIGTLDKGHIHPNRGDPEKPGIWFPLGYGQPTS